MMEIRAGVHSFQWWQGSPFPEVRFVRSIYADGDEAILLMELIYERRRRVHSALPPAENPEAIATDWNTQGESHAG